MDYDINNDVYLVFVKSLISVVARVVEKTNFLSTTTLYASPGFSMEQSAPILLKLEITYCLCTIQINYFINSTRASMVSGGFLLVIFFLISLYVEHKHLFFIKEMLLVM